MPTPSAKQLAKARKVGQYRLRCVGCNRELDWAKSIPKNWSRVVRVQSLKDSMTTYEGE